MDIEAVIAQATDVAPESKATDVAETAETPQKEAVTHEVAKPEIKPDSELTPEQLAKREANRQSHLNSKLAKMRRENRELRELAAKVTTQQAKPSSDNTNGAPVPPKEEDFQTWDELRAAERKYYEDLADWRIEQKLSERDKASTANAETLKIREYQAIKINEHAAKEAEFMKKVPDYEQTVYGEYADFMDNLPLPVAQALLEADAPELALYALAKEGNLEALGEMSPYKVSMEIGKAELRGETYLNQKKATNAPEPMEAARGTGNPGKALHNLSVEELMKRFN